MRRRTAGGLHQAEPVRPARADKVVWFLPGQADANDTEVLFFAYLLVANAETVEGLNNWAKRVVAEKAEAYEHKATWKPKAGEGGWSMHNKVSMLYEPMRQAYTQVAWPAELLDAIGVAMQVRRREAAEAAQQAQKERREAAEAARTRTAFGPIRA